MQNHQTNILIISNMGPKPAAPFQGKFVHNQVWALAALNPAYHYMRWHSDSLLNKWLKYPVFALDFLWRFVISRRRFDIVHVHYFYPTIWLALLYKALRNPKVKIVVTCHGSDIYLYQPPGKAYRWCAAKVDQWIFASKALARHFSLPVQQAEAAVLAAEQPTKDLALASYRVKLADKKVEIAKAVAQTNYLDEQYKTLGAQQADARLDSRTQEADSARYDAKLAREDATAAEAESELAKQQALELQQQIAELNAKQTERGWVVTLGDVLFDTGRAELKEGSLNNLSKLSAFLTRYQDRKVQIEGHTDSVGSSDSNQGLSERRAAAVYNFLTGKGIDAGRLVGPNGFGESRPIDTNDTAEGRARNRRTELNVQN